MSKGNMNLKGKKTKMMPCGCCDCVDKRAQALDRAAREEMVYPELTQPEWGALCERTADYQRTDEGMIVSGEPWE